MDGQRVAMTTTQAKHVVPCVKYNKLLIGSGAEKALPLIISDDFCFKAKQDGKVIDIDENLGILIIEYKDGSKDVVETNVKINKNGGGGFFITNKLESNVKIGDKFKKDDILAKNEQFFSNPDKLTKDTSFKAGTLAKIAIAQGYYTYEDSSIVTQKLCKDMATEVVMKNDIVLGKNSNIEYIAEKGTKIEVGDPLIIYDESYDEEGLNKMLYNLSDENKEIVSNLGKIPIKSHYSGVIEDVKIYSTVEYSELSTSMQKIIKKINKPIEDVKKIIDKHIKLEESNVILHPTEKINAPYGKVKGVDVGEGVLIEFYIKYYNSMGIGDKLSFFTALKSVICETIPNGLEPYSEFRPDEEVSAFLGPISILARMTGSIIPTMSCNKALIELKRKIKEIYDEK